MIKMKALSLPISSPSRTAAAEKLTAPQPLMRFLSGNAVRRSRARSRASPIFGRKKNNNAAGILMNKEATQEPYSPKVTCMGQVRARRATADSALNPGHTAHIRRGRWWLKKPLFCYRFRRYRAFRGLLSRWVLCNNGYCKKEDAREDHSFVEESEEFQAKVQEIVPSNALSLTRCKSVPRRSSYLGGRIWESTSESCERGVLKSDDEQNFQDFRSCSEIIYSRKSQRNEE